MILIRLLIVVTTALVAGARVPVAMRSGLVMMRGRDVDSLVSMK